LRRGAREDDLGSFRLAQDVQHEGLDAVARTIALARRLLADRQHRLGPPQLDDDVAALEAQDDAADDLALPILVVVVDVLSMRFLRPSSSDIWFTELIGSSTSTRGTTVRVWKTSTTPFSSL